MELVWGSSLFGLEGQIRRLDVAGMVNLRCRVTLREGDVPPSVVPHWGDVTSASDRRRVRGDVGGGEDAVLFQYSIDGSCGSLVVMAHVPSQPVLSGARKCARRRPRCRNRTGLPPQ